MKDVKKTIIGLGIITALTPTLSYANNGYVGASLGQTTYNDIFSSEDEAIASSLGVDLDDTDTGFKIFGGVRANEYVAFEAFYADLGAASIKSNVDKVEIETDALGAAIVGILPVSDSFQLYGKFGFHAWDAEMELTDGVSLTDDGTDTMFGAGAAYQLGNLSIRAEFERYTLDEVDVDLTSVGFAYHF